MSKKCFKCLTIKPLSEFYKHNRMGDGHLGKCKSCTKSDASARFDILKKNPEWLKKERDRCRKKQSYYRIIGTAKKPSKATRLRWSSGNSFKINAQRRLRRAVKKGIIYKPSRCNRCGSSGRLEAHHSDYSMPLSVEWLCTKCHGITRRKDQ